VTNGFQWKLLLSGMTEFNLDPTVNKGIWNWQNKRNWQSSLHWNLTLDYSYSLHCQRREDLCFVFRSSQVDMESIFIFYVQVVHVIGDFKHMLLYFLCTNLNFACQLELVYV